MKHFLSISIAWFNRTALEHATMENGQDLVIETECCNGCSLHLPNWRLAQMIESSLPQSDACFRRHAYSPYTGETAGRKLNNRKLFFVGWEVWTFAALSGQSTARLESRRNACEHLTCIFFSEILISYCWYNPLPMRNDHSIAGTTILQTTLEDADSTQFYWWLDKSGGKGSSWASRRFGVQHHRQPWKEK